MTNDNFRDFVENHKKELVIAGAILGFGIYCYRRGFCRGASSMLSYLADKNETLVF